MAGDKSLYPLARAERFALAFLILFSVCAFLPVWRSVEVASRVILVLFALRRRLLN